MSSENPFIHTELLRPDITDKVAAAYAHNLITGFAPNSNFTGTVATGGLADKIRLDTEAVASNNSNLASIERISDPETRDAFESSFTTAEQLFDRIGLRAPTAEECSEAGINLKTLADSFERMQFEGFEPAIVLAPILDLESWQKLYQNLTDYKQVKSGKSIEGSGLRANSSIQRHWTDLAEISSSIPTVTLLDTKNPTTWSLQLIPASLTSITHMVHYNPTEGMYPTICEYLALQASLLQAHRMPIDSGIDSAWLNGVTRYDVDRKWVPYGRWIEGDHAHVEIGGVTLESNVCLNERTPVRN